MALYVATDSMIFDRCSGRMLTVPAAKAQLAGHVEATLTEPADWLDDSLREIGDLIRAIRDAEAVHPQKEAA